METQTPVPSLVGLWVVGVRLGYSPNCAGFLALLYSGNLTPHAWVVCPVDQKSRRDSSLFCVVDLSS